PPLYPHTNPPTRLRKKSQVHLIPARVIHIRPAPRHHRPATRPRAPPPNPRPPPAHPPRLAGSPSTAARGPHLSPSLHPPPPLGSEMETLPLTAEAIAVTEKKMDMTLEDIIKMSKKKNPGAKKPPRQPIKKRPFQNGNSNQGNAKVQRFMESRSAIRQGVLAQRRSNLGGNQFPVTKQAAKKAAAMPMRNKARWNKPR
ncbi:unnamed protein product, partial [Urochloa humidicola]